MSTSTCRACGLPLPASEICRDCGEDHRAWYARLGAQAKTTSLRAQEADIRQMQARVRRQRTTVAEEAARLHHHRPATPAGQAVLNETRERVAKGLHELEAAGAELDAAALGVEAMRSHMTLEALRADLGRIEAAPVATLPPLEGALLDAATGMRIGRVGAQLTAWSPTCALRPAWTVPAPAGPLRFGGPALTPRIFVGTDPVHVLDPADGRTLWTWPGTLLDTWEDHALVATEQGVEVMSLLDGNSSGGGTRGARVARAERVDRGWLLPTGLLLGDAKGLTHLGHDGRVLGQGRFGSTVILSADRRTLVAFPMVLRLPELSPIAGLMRAPNLELGNFYLDSDLLIGWGREAAAWRLTESTPPKVLPLPARPTNVTRAGEVVLVRANGVDAGFALGKWPPQPLDPFEAARAAAKVGRQTAPTRFVFVGDTRIDCVHGTLAEKADFCHELARFAATRLRESGPAAREIALGILADALVLESDVLVRLASGLAAELAARPHAANMAAWDTLLDRIRLPMFLLESLPGPFDEASGRRIRGLLAACAGEALSAVGEHFSARAIRGEAEDGEIEACVAALGQVRARVLARAPGLKWTGLDALMVRWKQLGREAAELSDIAVATRALSRLNEASLVVRGADASAESAALRRVGRSIGDLAARSAAEAEVEAHLSVEGLQERIAEGLARARRDLR